MSVFRTGAGLLMARLCQPVFSFLLFGAAARLLDEQTFGAYVLLMSLLMFFQACANLGLIPLLTREVAQNLDRAGGYLGGAAIIMIPASVLSWFLFPPLLRLIGASEMTSQAGWILGAALPFTTAILMAEALFLAHGKPQAIVLQNLLENIVRVALSLIFLFMGYGLSALLLIYVVMRGAGACFILSRMLKLPGTRPITPAMSVTKMLLAGLPTYGLMAMGAMFFFKVDVIAVSTIQGEAMVGQYGAAYRLLAITFLLPDSFVGALFPRLSHMCANDPLRLSTMIPRFTRLILAVEIPICLTLAATSSVLLALIFGQGFLDTAPTLTVLALVLPFHTMNGLLGYLLQADGNEKTALYLVLGAVAANLMLTWPLTMAFGIIGAAIGTLLSTASLSLLHFRAVGIKIPNLRILDAPWRLIIPFAVGCACLLLPFRIFGINLLPIAVATILLFLLETVKRQDIKQLISLIRNKGGRA